MCFPWAEMCVGGYLWDEYVGLNDTTNLKAGKLGHLFLTYSREFDLMASGRVILGALITVCHSISVCVPFQTPAWPPTHYCWSTYINLLMKRNVLLLFSHQHKFTLPHLSIVIVFNYNILVAFKTWIAKSLYCLCNGFDDRGVVIRFLAGARDFSLFENM